MEPIYPRIHCTYQNQLEYTHCVHNFTNLVTIYGTDGYFATLGHYAFSVYEFLEKYNENPLHKIAMHHPALGSIHALVLNDVYALVRIHTAFKTMDDVAITQNMTSLVKNHAQDTSRLYNVFTHDALQAYLAKALCNQDVHTREAIDGAIESPGVKQSHHVQTVSLLQIPQSVFMQGVLKRLDTSSLLNFFCVSRYARAFRPLVFAETPQLLNAYLNSCLQNYTVHRALVTDTLIHETKMGIKEVDLSRCQELTDDIVALIASLFTNLKKIILARAHHEAHAVCRASTYNFVHCSKRTQITDAGLRHLTTVTQLQHLNIAQCTNITDAGLQHLASVTQLQWLNLNFCKQITDAGLQHLAAVIQLQHLSIAQCPNITDTGLHHLAAATQLQYLSLANCNKITDTGLQYLASCTQLQHLDIAQCTNITNTGLSHLAAMTRLQCVNLANCNKITDTGLQHLASCTQLRRLELHFCDKITNIGLQYLAAVTQLQHLDLTFCKQITSAGVQYLTAFTQLQWLDLTYCDNITDTALQHLAMCTQLQHVNLMSCYKITDTGLQYLAALTQLTWLDLHSCSITDVGLQHLAACTQLQRLDLTSCIQITDLGLHHLTALPQLKWLDLQDCNKITDAGLHPLFALKRQQWVRTSRAIYTQ